MSQRVLTGIAGSPIDLRGHFTGEETESQRRVVANPDGTI